MPMPSSLTTKPSLSKSSHGNTGTPVLQTLKDADKKPKDLMKLKSGTKWTEEEVKILIRELKAGKCYREISAIIHRSMEAIRKKVRQLRDMGTLD